MTKWKLFWAGTIAVALLASACSTETADDAEPAAPDQTPITTEADLEGAVFDLEATVSEFVGDRDGGVSVLTTRNGETSTVAVGIANNEGDALTPETPFRVGSISKPFVAVMVLQLVDEGLVALDETLGTYLPETPIGAMVTTYSDTTAAYRTTPINPTSSPMCSPIVTAAMTMKKSLHTSPVSQTGLPGRSATRIRTTSCSDNSSKR